jgi:hypothetical protein
VQLFQLVHDFVVTAEQFDGSFDCAVLESEVVDLVGFRGQIFPENVQRVAIVLVLIDQRADHTLLFAIVLCIHTGPYHLNMLNIRIQLGNNLEHLVPVIIDKLLNPRPHFIHFPFIRDADLDQCVNLT